MEWTELPNEEAMRRDEYTPERVFSKSRFHVMGEIKRSLQAQVTREYLKANSPSVSECELSASYAAHPGPECVYAHVDMDCYFVQVALLSHPELREKAVAVASGDSLTLFVGDT